MQNELPRAFLAEMEEMLQAEFPAFLGSIGQAAAVSLRVNPLKSWNCPFDESVPWEPLGRYVPAGFHPGLDPAYFGGGYYMQDAGAMMPARLLSARPGERILDLCAAPGGKSGQIAADLRGKGLLVANEKDPNRAKILAGNLERLGVTNAVVLNGDPGALAEGFPGFFDGIVADVPCSGEGMFRRDAAACREWTADSPRGCAARQRKILECAYRMLKPGGRLVYSTCTFNRTENEENVEWLLAGHPDMTPGSAELAGLGKTRNGCLRVWPHRVRGEGQFAALLMKEGTASGSGPRRKTVPNRPQAAEGEEFARQLEALLPGSMTGAFGERTPVFRGGVWILPPEEMPEIRGVRVLRTGLTLAETRGKTILPSHSLAMALAAESVPSVALDGRQARLFMAGETLPAQETGWRLMTWRNLPLGFAKGSDGQWKNHVPKGIRVPIRQYEAQEVFK